jgi:hypothetical protein
MREWGAVLRPILRLLDKPNVDYIRSQIESGDPSRTKKSLQYLCKLYRDGYFDGLEAVVLEWFTSEPDSEVSQHLLDHMVKQAPNCPSYESMVLEVYEKEPPSSALRQRMEASAAGTALYGKFKRMDASLDLFNGVFNVTNNTINVSGNLQAGAIAVGGDANNLAPTNNYYNQQTVEAIQSELSKLEAELERAKIDGSVKQLVLGTVRAAKADPSPDKISKVTSAVRHAGEIVLAGTTIWEIAHVIAHLAGLG